jgi:replicative DNA helicase
VTDLYDPPLTDDDAPIDTRSLERVPPQDLAAEMAVLGGMMTSADAVTEVTEILTGAEYYRPAHETIHKAILGLYAAGEPTDPVILSNTIPPDQLARIGGLDYLHRCYSAIPTAANTGYYAEIVKNKATLRKVIETGTALVGMGYAAATDQAEEVLDETAKKLHELTSNANTGVASREHLLSETLAATMANYHSVDGNYLPLPYRDLAEKCPMEPGDFVVIAATPGMGKTTILADIARCVAIKHGGRAYIGSMEMPHTQIGQRILCAEATVDMARFRARKLTGTDLRRIETAQARIDGAELRIDDTPAVPVSRMRTRARQMQAQGILPDVWIVDYLQIAKSEAKDGANRTNQVDQLAIDMRAFALEFGIVVIAAAQLNRQVSQRADKVPVMSDLRESGGIEHNGTSIIMLNRPDMHEPESPRAGEMDLHIVKNRMGSTGIVTVAYQGHYARASGMGEDI